MKRRIYWLVPFVLLIVLAGTKCGIHPEEKTAKTETNMGDTFEIVKSDAEWRDLLSAEEYRVLREKGTERPFSSEYETLWDSGTYICKACGAELFHSTTKFDAHCGWPSFYESIDKSAVKEVLESFVNTFAKLYASTIFNIENRKGKIVLANSFDPKTSIDIEVKPIKAILS